MFGGELHGVGVEVVLAGLLREFFDGRDGRSFDFAREMIPFGVDFETFYWRIAVARFVEIVNFIDGDDIDGVVVVEVDVSFVAEIVAYAVGEVFWERYGWFLLGRWGLWLWGFGDFGVWFCSGDALLADDKAGRNGGSACYDCD